MTDSRLLGTGAFGPEPAHDPALGALLRDVVGETPQAAVDWKALATRIGEQVGRQAAAPWWAYAAQWERRAIPLALAAGMLAAVALWSTTNSATTPAPITASGLATAVAAGTTAEDAASQFARSITNTVDLSAGVPE